MSTDTTTETPTTGQGSKTTKKKTKKKKRTRKLLNYALGWVNETEPERDGDGKVIEGSERPVLVLMDLPPGLDEAGKRNRESIERACKKAVYEKGMEEYGNKKLVVISYGEYFDIPFERTTVTRLLPPEKAEKVRAQNGKGLVVEEDEEEPESAEDETEDGEDDGDDDDGDGDED